MAETVDVLFIGTGAETTHMPAGLRDQLDEVGIGVEAMNSPAACRTYNVLIVGRAAGGCGAFAGLKKPGGYGPRGFAPAAV